MLFNHLPVSFPWYDNIEKQLRHRAPEYNIVCLISPKDAVLPFMFRRPTTAQMPTSWKVYNLDGSINSDLAVHLYDIQAKTLEGWDYFWMVPSAPMAIGDPLTLELAPGCYYMQMEFPSGLPAFSEVFRVPSDSFSIAAPQDCNFIKLEWNNMEGDVSPIYYPTVNPFKNVAYLDSRITASEPEIEEDVEKDGNNVDVPTFQRGIIRYRITAFAADFLKVALSLMPMHDNIILTTPRALETGALLGVEVTSAVEEGGIISTVDILFEQDILIVAKACGDHMVPEPCPPMPSTASIAPANVGVTNWQITGILPSYTWGADIIGYDGLGDDYVMAANVTRQQLAIGFAVDSALWPDIVSFSLRIKNLNCTLGQTDLTLF